MITSRVLFRADGGPLIGWGHLYRCMALAEMLSEKFEPVFLLNEAPKTFLEDLRNRGITYKFAPGADITSLGNGKDILVLDGYSFTTEMQTSFRKKMPVVCIDDLGDKRFDADLVINHCPGVRESDYNILDGDTRFALGLDYALLRSEFLDAARNHRDTRSGDRLVICFGGADPLNLTHRVLSKLVAHSGISQIDVIIGGSYPFENSLARLITDKVTLYKSLSAREMVQRLLANDIAIVSSSSILFECIALGLNCLSIAYVENQVKIHNGFLNMGLIHPISDIDHVDRDLTSVLENTNVGRHNVIDGLSGQRLLEKIKSLAE